MKKMNHRVSHRKSFKISNVLTNLFPHAGAWLLNMTVSNLLGNEYLLKVNFYKAINRLEKINNFKKILVVGDLNIGDAINLQASIAALRDFFPNSGIDYMISRTAGDLIEGNPEISTLLPIFSGTPTPKKNDFNGIHYFIISNSYDVIFNFCPLFKEEVFFPYENRLISFYPLAATLIHNENDPYTINNIAYQTYQFVNTLFSSRFIPVREQNFRGVNVFLSDRAINQANIFLEKHNLHPGDSLVLYNPDTSSKFTRVLLSYQISIIKNLVKSRQVKHILLGGGHSQKNIESEILTAIPYPQRKKIIIVPASFPLYAYAALIDLCDIYITGDTGPLLIAAARKFSHSKNHKFRNRTAIFSIFGATPARIYGYDSNRKGFFPANQDAPSRVYISESPCRNITCINKANKTCKTVRCFEFLDTKQIVSDVVAFLNTIEKSYSKKVLKIISKAEQVAVY